MPCAEEMFGYILDDFKKQRTELAKVRRLTGKQRRAIMLLSFFLGMTAAAVKKLYSEIEELKKCKGE